MTDNMISTIGKVDLDRTSRPVADEVRVKEKDGGSPAARYAASVAPVSKGLSDVLLRFKVDPGTKQVTVMVVDKSSRKVVRTIPPDELKTLNEGELFELFT